MSRPRCRLPDGGGTSTLGSRGRNNVRRAEHRPILRHLVIVAVLKWRLIRAANARRLFRAGRRIVDGHWVEHRLGRCQFCSRIDHGRKAPLCPIVQIGQRIYRPPAVLLEAGAFAGYCPLRERRYGDADTVLAAQILRNIRAAQPRRQVGKIGHGSSLSSRRAELREYARDRRVRAHKKRPI